MRREFLLPLASVSTLALASVAFAQDSQMLEKITLIAEGQENIEATGGSVVTQDDLETLQPADVSELFARESSVSVSGGPGPSRRVHVFGMEQSNLAVTVDGVPQGASSWHHTGSNVIDPVFLKRVEVEAGAAAADSGFAAAAGALRYETVGADDLLEDGQSVGGRAALSYGSNGRGTSASVAGYGRHGSFDWFVMLHGTDGKNYRNGAGTEILGTEPAAQGVLAKFGYEFEDHRIELGYERSRDDGDRTIKMNLGLADDTVVHPLIVSRDALTLKYTSTNPTAGWDPEVMFYVSQQGYWRNNYTTLRGGVPVLVTNGNMILDEDQTGGVLKNTFSLGAGTITAGVDFGQHDFSIDNYGNNDRRYRDFSTTQAGAFLQGRFEFDNGIDLSTGARFDHHRFTDWNGQRFTGSGASANATLSYEFADGYEVFAGASRTWLGYVLGDYAYLHARTNAFVTDPNFAPGVAKNIKLGFNANGENWNGGITFFDTRISGMPDYTDPSLDNDPDEWRSRGVTLNAAYDWGDTRIGASFTKAKVTTGGAPTLPEGGTFMPVGDMASLYVDHEMPGRNLKIGATVEWAGKLEDPIYTAAGFVTAEAYTVVNAYAEWSPPAYENLSIRLGVDNLFDRNYYERSGYNQSTNRGGIAPAWAPGRTVTLGASMKF